jgi:predicted DNA-binding ribbon-helix-helix protein
MTRIFASGHVPRPKGTPRARVPKVRLNIRLEESLVRAIKKIANDRSTTVTAIIRSHLNEVVEASIEVKSF